MDIVERLRESAREWANEVQTRIEAADEIERLRNDLTAAQAREAKLREAVECLAKLADDDRLPFDYALAGEIFHEVAALDSDDTALRERLKDERERCALLLDELLYLLGGKAAPTLGEMASAIRALED